MRAPVLFICFDGTAWEYATKHGRCSFHRRVQQCYPLTVTTTVDVPLVRSITTARHLACEVTPQQLQVCLRPVGKRRISITLPRRRPVPLRREERRRVAPPGRIGVRFQFRRRSSTWRTSGRP